MQIICPHCTTSYAIDPAKFGAAGRSVRCARCQQVWLASVEAVVPAASFASVGYESEPETRGWTDRAAVADARSYRNENDAPHHDSPPISGAGEQPIEETADDRGLDNDDRWPEHPEHDDIEAASSVVKSRFARLGQPAMPVIFSTGLLGNFRARLGSVNLSAVCAISGTLVLALVIWRADVVRLLPQTATFFKMAGMGVNLRGLAFEDVRITTENVGNRPVLVIQGAIVDVARKPVEVPRLRFVLRDAQGADIYGWNAVLEQPVLNPGERAMFTSRLASPPPEGREIAVRFFHKRDIAAGGT